MSGKRFIKMEDNEDGTMTITINMGPEMMDGMEGEAVLLIEMPFDEMMREFMPAQEELEKLASMYGNRATLIPNEMPE